MATYSKSVVADATNLVLKAQREVLTLIERMGLQVTPIGELSSKRHLFKFDDRKLTLDERQAEYQLINAINRVRLHTAMVNETRTDLFNSSAIINEHTRRLNQSKESIKERCQNLKEAMDDFKSLQDRTYELFKESTRQFTRPIATLKKQPGPDILKESDMKKEKKAAETKPTTTKSTGGETVEQLLKQLKNSTDKTEKRNLRARLRTMGHSGGLGIRAAEMANEGFSSTGKKTEKKVSKKEVEVVSTKKKTGKRSSK